MKTSEEIYDSYKKWLYQTDTDKYIEYKNKKWYSEEDYIEVIINDANNLKKIIKALEFIQDSRKSNNLWRIDTEELANKIEDILRGDKNVF